VFKTKIQDFLGKIGAYDRLKETFAYDVYRWMRHGRALNWRNKEVLFYRSLFGDRPEQMLIFDIGANRGQRTRVFLGLGATVVAVEPDSANQRLLEKRFRRSPTVTVVGKAVSKTAGTATLLIHKPGSGLNSLSSKWVRALEKDEKRFGRKLEFSGTQYVETVTLDGLIAEFGTPYYVKIDVEGHEPSVLQGLARTVPLLSFEVNLPEFLDEGVECVEILGRLDEKGRFNWSRDCQGAFALSEWVSEGEFMTALRGCRERSIEVFWRLPYGRGTNVKTA
jgi:FkbM family methyltransferase